MKISKSCSLEVVEVVVIVDVLVVVAMVLVVEVEIDVDTGRVVVDAAVVSMRGVGVDVIIPEVDAKGSSSRRMLGEFSSHSGE